MSDNLHRKLAEKLRQESGYPDFRHEDWLALDTRLEGFDRRRRRRGAWLWFALPLAALAGLNLYLLLLKHETAMPSNLGNEQKTTVVFDTIIKKVTVYEFDTVYRKTYLADQRPFSTPGFNQKNEGPATSFHGGGPIANDNPYLPNESPTPFESLGNQVLLPQTADSLEGIGYLLLGELEFHKKRKHLETNVLDNGVKIRRTPLLQKAQTAFSVGATLPQQTGANALPGIRLAWENEFALAQDKVWLWESLGWEQLRLQGREHAGIPGFPKPQNPEPGVDLEKVNYESHTITAQLGLTLQLETIKNLHTVLGAGLGGNYRFVSSQVATYESGSNEDYDRVKLRMNTGWAGFSGHLKAGLGWQINSVWQARLMGTYGHLFKNQLPEGNLRRWWGMDLGIFYRWR